MDQSVKTPSKRLNPALLIFLIFPLVMTFLALTSLLNGGSNSALQPPAIAYTPDVLVGKLAPDFTLNTLDGKPLTLSSLRGKIVFLNFWATWCGPCRQEMPAFQALFDDKTQTQAVILGVNQLEDVAAIQSFYKELSLNIPTVLDIDGKVRDAYQVPNLPRTFVIDPAGTIKAEVVGQLTAKMLDEYIKKLSSTGA